MSSDPLHAAFVLHYRPYRDTSLIADIFTQDYGRISVVARAARNPKSPWKGILQPFVPIWIRFTGKSDLLALRYAEAQGVQFALKGEYLFSALYINELLLRVLQRYDPYPILFERYTIVLQQLENQADIEKILRQFEFILLKELGYALNLAQDADTGIAVEEQAYYNFDPIHGVRRLNDLSPEKCQKAYIGKHLLVMQREEFNDTVLPDAKRLLRCALLPLIGEKPLQSRQLFKDLSGSR